MRVHWGIVCIVVAMLVGCMGFGAEPSSGNSAEEMFRAVVVDPIPAYVTELQGVGDTWQGYSLFLRFQVTDIEAFTVEVVEGTYNEVDCAAALPAFALPTPDYDDFTPSWQPQDTADTVCYVAAGITNGWTYAGQHALLVDKGSGVVYFQGIGG